MSRQRLALCVGLNYPGTSAALSGCVNDAYDWRDALMAREHETRVLLEPTKAELVAELKGTVARARRGDRVVFTFSGHGTNGPDRSGDEPDGRDEALCCADYNSGGLLWDDEIMEIFGMARFGVRRTILADSCHSGTVARDLVAVQRQPRFISPAAIDAIPLSYEQAVALERNQANKPSRHGAILISGCADPEYSYDASFGGRPNGAFTRAAIDTLPFAKNVIGWHRKIRERLPSASYPQSPQLTATPYQRYLSPL